MVEWEVYLHHARLSQNKSHCSFYYCWPVYHSQPLQRLQLLQYSKLHMAKTVGKASFVQVYNTYIPLICLAFSYDAI